ncbi:MAG: molybdopterin converting factor subunit 1 [Tepidisphaeraceae bacterium]
MNVKLFAILRERAQTSELTLDLPASATITAAREALAARVPALRDYLPRVAWAVNRAYVPVETELHDGDELAVIPPVSGG